MSTRFGGDVIVVTGAAGGIGSATCVRLARDGATVLAVDVDEGRLALLVEALPGEGHASLVVDLTDLSRHAEIVAAARSLGHSMRGLVHLAAVLRRRSTINDVTEEDWDVQLTVNLKVAFFLDRAVSNALIEQGRGGVIVNFSSQGWWTGGFGGSVVYAASKGGIVSMSRGLARSLAPHGIRVNAVAPGFVETEMMLSGLSQSEIDTSIAMVPLGRMATPEEVADAAAFLLSDDARYVSGATLNVTGAQLMY
jgi:NAD(P)-dependent dehydrogenase (short-subunit alcohol dehydrogenase family)